MPTRAEVSADITAKITSKTAAGSLSNVDDGANRELILDYIDQEVGGKVKTLKTTITSAQMLALFSTPVTILTNTTAGVIKQPSSVYIVYRAGSTGYYQESYYLNVIREDTGSNLVSLASGYLSEASNAYSQAALGNPMYLSGSIRNNSYLLKANTSNPTSGDGELDIYVTYIEITL